MNRVMNGRTVVFIDSGHLRILLNRVGLNNRICILKLAQKLAEGGELVHGFYYDCMVQGQNERFLDVVGKLPGITVRLGKLNDYQSGRVEKQVDVQLAVDVTRVVATQGRVQTVVILTGDADFIPAVEDAQLCGVRVLVAHAPPFKYERLGVADRLMQAADGSIILDYDWLLDTVRDNIRGPRPERIEPQPESAPGTILLPAPPASICIGPGDERRIEKGEVGEVLTDGRATVCEGGIAVARAGSHVHALRGGTVYLCADDVHLTGTSRFTVIRSA